MRESETRTSWADSGKKFLTPSLTHSNRSNQFTPIRWWWCYIFGPIWPPGWYMDRGFPRVAVDRWTQAVLTCPTEYNTGSFQIWEISLHHIHLYSWVHCSVCTLNYFEYIKPRHYSAICAEWAHTQSTFILLYFILYFIRSRMHYAEWSI